MFRVYRTVNHLLSKRGYQEVSQDNKDFSDRTKLTILTHKIDNPDDRIFVFFPTDEKVGVKSIRQYKKQMKEEKVYRAIVVVIESITPFAKGEIQKAKRVKNDDDVPLIIECFHENELYIDITEHELVPEHELLSSDEKNELLNKLKIKENQLPKMLTTDPISRYYGLEKGDVVKITRPSETAGLYVNYRLVF